MTDDTLDSAQELADVLQDVRRHLLWQEETGGRALLVDARVAAELQQQRAAASSVRSMIARARPPEPAVAPPAPRPPVESPSRDTLHAAMKQPLGAPRPPPPAPPPVMASRPLAADEGAPRAAPAPSPGMLLDVPRTTPRSSGALPGVVEGERPTLDQIRRELGDCRRCKLCTGRKNIVFGSGNPRADLVFVGEGPGENEDIQGVPFVGAAGDLLTKMIGAMGFTRDDVYICNVVKCRPPGNRNPEPDEIAACEPFLRSQLLALQPKVIVALGKFAAQTLLRDTTPITRMRGAWREYEGIRLMPTFHPAYLLRNSAEKRKAWEDLQQVMKLFGKHPGSSA
ncbi:uracil-DNA glycosylase [Corallococcus silvisoli]|uniref:uracil-DNA glycosylase n=1 Tax=Corallococcus silvisoli TaxID=2697031 RepID=UPI0013767B7D|nr:uracil-DNA glycosylase family protein [Corallococcus silvisoli]NBD13389.1 uracil-DNA glycosylase [Corallococcus silvisoli]